jgi:hypothetical protein
MVFPVAFFAYKRPYHTYLSLSSLSLNKEAKETELNVFLDGHRKISEIHLIDNVEKIINSFSTKFKSIEINRSDINLSGGTNQRRGITNILSKNEAVISIEDDIVVSKYFLSYMNKALEIYKNNSDVWHINGFNYPIKIKSNSDSFFMRSMQCWGWATWQDRWNKFMNDPFSNDPYYLKAIFKKEMIKEFDLNVRRSYFWSQIEDNASGKLNNTWDIFWYSYIFKNSGLCLTPKVSLTRNIGHDGSGEHSIYDEEILYSNIHNKQISNFPKIVKEDKYIISLISKYLEKKLSLKSRILRKLNNLKIFLERKIF